MAEILYIPKDSRPKLGIEKQVADLRTEFKTEIANVKAEIAHVKADLIKWMFVFWIGQVIVVGSLMGFGTKMILTAIGR